MTRPYQTPHSKSLSCTLSSYGCLKTLGTLWSTNRKCTGEHNSDDLAVVKVGLGIEKRLMSAWAILCKKWLRQTFWKINCFIFTKFLATKARHQIPTSFAIPADILRSWNNYVDRNERGKQRWMMEVLPRRLTVQLNYLNVPGFFWRENIH